MGGGACGGEYYGDDGVDTVDGNYVAATKLWWDEFVDNVGGNWSMFTTFVLYWKRGKK